MTSQRLINNTLLAASALTFTTIATTNYNVHADETTTPVVQQTENLDQQIQDTQAKLTAAKNQLQTSNNEQTQQLTNEMNNAVQNQKQANAQEESQIIADNNQQLQNVQQQNNTNQQTIQKQIDQLNQKQDQQIAETNNQTKQAVTTEQQQAQTQINAVNQEAEQAIANAKQEVANAQANQPQPYNVKPVNYGNLHDPSINYGFKTDQFENKAYGDTLNGEYPRFTPYDTASKDKVDWSSQPQSIQDIPTNFTPGLIAYNPSKDNSETISPNGLTDEQLATIRAFATKWTNDFRNYVYDNEPDVWNHANRNHPASDRPMEILITDKTNQLGDQVANSRDKHHVDNNHHSIKASGIDDNETYTALTNQLIGNTNKDILNEINQELMSNHSINVKGIQVAVQSNGENLMTVMGKYNTMQAYLTEMYNMMQAMYYGELVQTHGNNINIGGHVNNVLNSTTKYMGIGMQKLNSQSDATKLTKTVKGPVYAMTFDFIGNKVILNMDDKGQKKEYEQKFQKLADTHMQQTLGDAIDLSTDSIYHQALMRQTAKTSDNIELTKAQNKLTQIQQTYAQKVNDLKAESQKKINKLNDNANNQIKAIKESTQKQINDLQSQKSTSIDTLKAQLDQKLEGIKTQNAKKIDAIKAEYQTKINALPKSNDQIKQLELQLNNLKTKKDNQTVINTDNGKAQIVLPETKKDSNSESQTPVQFPVSDEKSSETSTNSQALTNKSVATTPDVKIDIPVADDNTPVNRNDFESEKAKPKTNKATLTDQNNNTSITQDPNVDSRMDDVIDGTPSVEEEIQNHQDPTSDEPINSDINTPVAESTITNVQATKKASVNPAPVVNTIATSTSGQKQTALPQTGNQKQNVLSIIGLSMLSLFSFGLLKNKKHA